MRHDDPDSRWSRSNAAGAVAGYGAAQPYALDRHQRSSDLTRRSWVTWGSSSTPSPGGRIGSVARPQRRRDRRQLEGPLLDERVPILGLCAVGPSRH